ncbi:MAG: lactaldehyde reductase [Clostridia bacterium]|jgi:lactaldehyde reductase|nr:lactaldehyde reductase [Clostridium sp.]HJJ13160.1 lactaldehyde reductase [Clostridiaceae bacterium]
MSIEKFVLNETSYFGFGAREVLPEEIKNRGYKKVLVVTDKSLFEIGLTKKVTDKLEEAGIEYTVFSDVKPNPTVKNVKDGLEVCRNFGADVIVAVGGGSSIDTAKGISVVMTNPDREDIVSLNGLSNTINKGMPLIALPTTHGTAAEVTINYVITDEEREVKMVCVDPHDIPLVAIVDTELMSTLPKSIAASTGMDALTHAIEGYITKAHNTMSDMFHMRAIELIFENLPAAVNERNQEAIDKMGLAQYIAGMGFSNVGLGIVHSMAHQLGAVYDTPHGLANAILLPTVMRYNGQDSETAQRFREILINIGRPDAAHLNDQDVINTFVWKISELSKEVGITQTIKDVGAKEEDFGMLADKAMEDPCKPGNPREVSREDFIELYRQAM